MQAVIIAAGESSRFWPLNNHHKSQMYVLGKPLIYWTIKGLWENGIYDVAVVCRPNSSMQEMLEKENDLGVKISYVAQEESLGTGNALWQARDFIRESFFVAWPNKVSSKEIVSKMIEKSREEGASAVFVGADTMTPWEYGVARFEGGRVGEICENPAPGSEPSNVKIIGVYFFHPDFFEYYSKLSHRHEADFIQAINLYIKDKKASMVVGDKDIPALKYPWDMFLILDILVRSKNFHPLLARSATIGEQVIIRGDVSIGENTIIKDHTVIEGPCFIGDDCEIGYHNVLRGPLDIERNVKTGAFCEIKHSIIQEGTHIHSGYVGDSIIGQDCRFGAGFITANRRLDREMIRCIVKGKSIDTGLASFGAVIGDRTHFGIHSGIMPGIFVGSECVIGPGTIIFENLPDKTVFYLRQQEEKKQVNPLPRLYSRGF